MNIISLIWDEGLYRPLFNILVFLYNTIPGHDIGVAIIILTALLRFALWPLSQKSIKSQKALQELQPKMNEIKKKYKNNKEKQAQATMEFYKKNKINPLGSCLPMLIQLPILIALYRVLRDTVGSDQLNALYYFILDPGRIDPYFLGLIDLAFNIQNDVFKEKEFGTYVGIFIILLMLIFGPICIVFAWLNL